MLSSGSSCADLIRIELCSTSFMYQLLYSVCMCTHVKVVMVLVTALYVVLLITVVMLITVLVVVLVTVLVVVVLEHVILYTHIILYSMDMLA